MYDKSIRNIHASLFTQCEIYAFSFYLFLEYIGMLTDKLLTISRALIKYSRAQIFEHCVILAPETDAQRFSKVSKR